MDKEDLERAKLLSLRVMEVLTKECVEGHVDQIKLLGPALVIAGMSIAIQTGEAALGFDVARRMATKHGVLKSPDAVLEELKRDPRRLAEVLGQVLDVDVVEVVDEQPGSRGRRFPWL
jgi:hypothetical protein